MPFPWSEELRRPGAWWAHYPRCVVHLITAPVPATPFPGCSIRAPSQACRVSPLGAWSQAATLLVDVNCPGSQEDLVSNWKPAHSLVEDAVSGAEIAACLPALAVTCLPVCLWQGDGPVFSQLALLWYLFNLCPVSRPGCALGWSFSWENSLSPSLFFSFWLSYSLGCYLTLAPSDCPQGIQAWSLP